VQIKQYEMEILLSLVAIWQLLELLEIRESRPPGIARYLLLCLSFLISPFFSYTYPIAVAPVFIVMFVQGIQILVNKEENLPKREFIIPGMNGSGYTPSSYCF